MPPLDPLRYSYPTPGQYGGGRTLADLGGDPVAQIILQRGNAQAEAYRSSGDIWAHTLAGLGQNVGAALMEGAKKDEESKVQNAVHLATSGQYPSATQPVPGSEADVPDPGSNHMQAIMDSLPPESRDKALKGIQDFQAHATEMQKANLAVQEQAQKLKDLQAAADQKVHDTLAVGAAHSSTWFDQPDGGVGAANAFHQSAAAAGLSDNRMDQWMASANDAYQAAQGDPQRMAAFKQAFQQQAAPILQGLMDKASPEAAKTIEGILTPKTREVKVQNADGSITTQIVEDKPGQTFAGAAPRDTRSIDEQLAEAASKGDQATYQRLLRVKQDAAAAGREPDQAPTLTPAGLDMAALNFKKTGNMIPMGMGKAGSGVRQAVVNRAATLTPEDIARIEAGGNDVAGNKAGYGADTASLKKLQQQTDAVAAFESTATKNTAILKDVLKRVPDLGTSLANRPIRALAGKLGSDDIARLNSIRQSVQNEYSRIISNPNLSGTMSDSARKEGEALLDPGLTVSQFVAALDTLQAEAKNRHDSYSEQLKSIRGRIGGSGASTPAPAAGPEITATGPNGQKVVLRNGQWVQAQ